MAVTRALLPAVLLVACATDASPSAAPDAAEVTDGVDVADTPDVADPLDVADPPDVADAPDGAPDTDAVQVDTAPPSACEAPDDSGAGFVFDPAGAGFFRLPWPHDARVTASGSPDLSDFPLVDDNALIDLFRVELEAELDGFATMPVVYLPLRADPAALTLPTPRETLQPDASVQLLRLGAGCGERVPIEVVARSAPDGDVFLPSHALVASPVPGFALEPAATYALVATTGLGAQSSAFRCALAGEHPDSALAAAYAPLRSCLATLGVAHDGLAMAAVFTTQDPVAELRALRDFVADPQKTPTPAVYGWELESEHTYTNRPGEVMTWVGWVDLPVFQRGESPYATSGGGFEYDTATGLPIVQRHEATPIIVSTPDGPGPFPVLIWQSGSRANLTGHIRQPHIEAMLAAGVAVAKFHPQFHGERATPGSNADLHTYNYLNPESARAVLRQQVIDASAFVRVVRESLPLMADLPPLDTARLVMGGHSQGAVCAAMGAAVEPDVAAWLMTGVGTYMSETIVHRDDPFDVPELLAALFDLQPGLVDRFHPIVQLLQLGAEVVDPMNHLRAWRGWAEHPAGTHGLLLNGYHDLDVYFVSMNAMTIGADAAPIAPPGWDPDPFDVWEREPEPVPISGNRASLSGAPLTIASLLDADHDHFIAWDSQLARDLAVRFVTTAFAGVPEVWTEALER